MTNQDLTMRDVWVGARRLEGVLRMPERPAGLVIFAHGSGSSRFSPRNTQVAVELGRRGLATLLFDLLTTGESDDRRNVFDIPLLGDRMCEAIDWSREEPASAEWPLGLFGASTGAAAALVAAARWPQDVAAVVSRGGRPDLAEDALPKVRAPTLLIVGGEDDVVIRLNQRASERMTCEWSLQIVPGATHLFEERGTLEQVIDLAGDWFLSHLGGSARRHG